MGGKTTEELLGQAVDALERSATANEALLKIAEQEQLVMTEPGPSICPHCGAVNPTVHLVDDSGGSGPLDEFVLVGETECCRKTIYAIPHEFTVVPTRDAAVQLMNDKTYSLKGGNRT